MKRISAATFIVAFAVIGSILLGTALCLKIYHDQHHTCVDSTHQSCDGECDCDGYECK